MELKQCIEERSSVREFTKENVAVDDLKEMIRRAGLAPSINNSQPWSFLVVTNADMLQKMAEVVHQKIDQMFPDEKLDDQKKVKLSIDKFSTFFADAPAVILVKSASYQAVVDRILPEAGLDHDTMNAMRNHPNIQSIGAAVQNILLSAVDLGYGACWLTGLLVAREELETLLHIEAPYYLAACVAIGKPAGEPHARSKKELDEIFEIMA